MGSTLPSSTSGSSGVSDASGSSGQASGTSPSSGSTPSPAGGTSSQFGTQSGTQSSQSSSSQPGSTSINVQGLTPSDQMIVQQVRQTLQSDSTLAPVLPQVQITISSGTAILSGQVNDEQQKQQVESAVKKATGVTSVNNQLQTGSSGALRPTSGTNSSQRIYHEPNEAPR
jgi:osmotically-inducible protein OsmY